MRRNLILIAVLVVVGFGIVLFALGSATTRITEKSSTTVAKIGNADVTLEYALTSAERAQGLSGRANLPQQTGLLFIFPYADRYNFWMKDMHFPIDIIWIDADRRVVGIEQNVEPDSYPQTFSPGVAVPYVLEVNAGFAQTYGVRVGDSLILEGGWPQ